MNAINEFAGKKRQEIRSHRGIILLVLGLLIIITCLIGFITSKTQDAEAASIQSKVQTQESGIVSQQITIENKEASVGSKTVECTLSKKVPKAVRRWCELITKYSLKSKIDPVIVTAMIMQESGGDPNVISKSGAVGLMQIMASTGLSAQLYPGTFNTRPTVQELLDPETNIKTGCQILAQKSKENDGDIKKALIAYGPSDQPGYYLRKVMNYYNKFK